MIKLELSEGKMMNEGSIVKSCGLVGFVLLSLLFHCTTAINPLHFCYYSIALLFLSMLVFHSLFKIGAVAFAHFK